MSDDVTKALQAVVEQLDAGEARDGQMTMAQAVMEALRTERHLVVRAGTGTGKSLGYLVPAALSKKRVVVATATKALQDQLAANDLPLVAKGSKTEFSYEVLKGRSNYLCLQRVKETASQGLQATFDDPATGESSSGRFAGDVTKILEWAKTTRTGDQSELVDEPHPRVWSAFSVSAEECPGAFKCPSGQGCFAEAARTRAAEADIVVANMHLVGADIASGGVVLPEHDVLIVDEAHDLESVLSASLGGSLSAQRVRAVAQMARRMSRARGGAAGAADSTDPTDVAGAGERLVDVADRFDRLVGSRGDERLTPPLWPELSSLLELLSSRLTQLERALRSSDSDGAKESDEQTRALLAAARLREIVSRIISFDDGDVAWIEGGPRPSIVLAPIDVSSILKEQVFSQRTVVLTSATVPNGLAVHLGADIEQVNEIDVGSPFDYENNALLYCAAHLPDRRSPGAEEMAIDELAELIDAAGGRTLALFTSWAAMTRAVTALRSRIEYPILAQGEQTRPALLEAFREKPSACLFATMGFWQGVDVPGPTLSLVAIDRIPFPRPDDPLLSARRERVGPTAFRDIDLPRAATLLAQGSGRLIRNLDDRGVVAILDSRLATASYRWTLIKALPPMRRTKNRQVVRAFLRSITAE